VVLKQGLPMRTILVPVGGSDTDHIVFQTAMAVARPLIAHLEFLHVHVGVAEAALHAPHLEFARGAALQNALNDLEQRSETRATAAARNVRESCAHWKVDLVEEPCLSQVVTARWRQEEGDASQRLMFHARHNDLIVMGRPADSDGLPKDRLETLLMGSGRPLLIAPVKAPMAALSTVMVCWKEAPEAARAVSAAMPLLTRAHRVIVVSIRENSDRLQFALNDLVDALAWHGIKADSHVLARDGRSTTEVLFSTALRQQADLMVMGGYGHSHAREVLFGGCTQAAIEAAELPIFLLH
jgi:nucleotide-binding universal stress UspA family protein